jgi:hypothetical protein
MGMSALLLTMEQVKAFRPLPNTAPWHKDQRELDWFKLDYPINYKVPDFGVDHDIIATQKHISD